MLVRTLRRNPKFYQKEFTISFIIVEKGNLLPCLAEGQLTCPQIVFSDHEVRFSAFNNLPRTEEETEETSFSHALRVQQWLKELCHHNMCSTVGYDYRLSSAVDGDRLSSHCTPMAWSHFNANQLLRHSESFTDGAPAQNTVQLVFEQPCAPFRGQHRVYLLSNFD